MIQRYIVAIGSFILLTNGAIHAAPKVVDLLERYQPQADITADPGCGVEGRSPDEMIEHNRRLAELYFINFQQDKERGRNWNWAVHDCFADNATILLGSVDPLAIPATRIDLAKRTSRGSSTGSVPGPNPEALSGEQLGYFSAFPDWQTVDGSLMVVPFEEGAFFRMMYEGHDLEGNHYSIWETNLILVNEQGLISHFEMWNDTVGMDATTLKVFGKKLSEMNLGGYYETTDGFSENEDK